MTGSVDSAPLTVSRIRRPVTTDFSPSTATTAVLVRKVILSLSRARSSMILEARNSSRRCRVTLRAKRVRKVASSIAESPPPMTAMSWSLKKKPSQVAQALTTAAVCIQIKNRRAQLQVRSKPSDPTGGSGLRGCHKKARSVNKLLTR